MPSWLMFPFIQRHRTSGRALCGGMTEALQERVGRFGRGDLRRYTRGQQQETKRDSATCLEPHHRHPYRIKRIAYSGLCAIGSLEAQCHSGLKAQIVLAAVQPVGEVR